MYWLIGTLIIGVMLGVLAVASSLASTPITLVITSAYSSLSVFFLAAILLFLTARHSALIAYPTHLYVSKKSSKAVYSLFYYVMITGLTIAVIAGSALQAISQYQQAESTKITDTLRIKALVTIEGVSDSVYNAATNSSYRQVATISDLSPLVSDITAAELTRTSFSDVNSSQDPTQTSTYKVLLNAYPKESSDALDGLNDLRPGDQLFMSLTLSPLATSEEAMNNPSGFDSYRWLRGRHIDGVAAIGLIGEPIANITEPSAITIEPSANITEPSAIETRQSTSYLERFRTRIDQKRWQLRQHFYQDWETQSEALQQANAVTLSLLTGDRSLINRSTKDLYQLAGISHLLAISGTHVLFLAIVMAGLATFIVDRHWPTLYRYLPRWQVRWYMMISAAFIYALFTGFDVPAARTAWTLLAIGFVRLTLLPISTLRVLLALAIIMAWIDPYVLWQAGYWLSFIAVALLLKYDDAYVLQAKAVSGFSQTKHSQLKPNSIKGNETQKRKIASQFVFAFKRLFKLQCWLFIALLPVTLLLFGKASLWGLIVNLFAIGLFGWVIVPLNLLAGLCYLIVPTVADVIWTQVSMLVLGLHKLLLWLTSLPALLDAWLYTPVNAAILFIAFLVILPWLLPRGLISRVLALPPLTLLIMTIYANAQTLAQLPTLYVLPTGDEYLSAAILRYSATDQSTSHWLFLADHRARHTRSSQSALNAQKLSASLDQQLRTLSIKRLDGIVVQTSAIDINTTSSAAFDELLPRTVDALVQSMPVSQYWQAGRYNLWTDKKRADQALKPKIKDNDTRITAQQCGAEKTWQMANKELSIEALTGWNEIDDASVWDCTIALNSRRPIKVVRYNPSNPLQSPQLSTNQHSSNKGFTDSALPSKSQARIVLDVATHKRTWQMWSLLCDANSFATAKASGDLVTWLSHSSSQVTTEILAQYQITESLTYDGASLPAALALDDR